MPVSGKRRLWFAAFATIVVVASIASRAVSEPPRPLQREGDRSAAAFADETVLDHLRSLARVSDHPSREAAAFLARAATELGDLFPFDLVLLSQKGDTFVVASYRFEEGSDLLRLTGDYWGRACREYVVATDRVTTSAVACPPGTPERPRGRGD